ncbi:MAG: hypothetical protein HXX13_02065 [Bacteroidetes bacterium]|nr:hypothetical protein [Bacteroidota bacterium]
MKKNVFLIFCISILLLNFFNPQLKAQSVKWNPEYSFDKCNSFVIEFYAKNNELMKTKNIKTYYQLKGQDFLVKSISEIPGNGVETIIDKTNEVAIQIFGTGGSATPMYNAGGYKFPTAEYLKKLELIPTEEKKEILGYLCKKYTYTYKKIFGEIWLTDLVTLSNDVGVFRACKMAALHNTLSAPGFVMEMTTEDAKGGKTQMKTVSLQKDEKYSVDLKNVEVSKALNKVNYFTF